MKKFITLHQFNGLSNKKKYDLLDRYGTYLGRKRKKDCYAIGLFELCGFYVEVWLNEASDRVEKASGFDNYKKLDAYVGSIDLSSIYCLL